MLYHIICDLIPFNVIAWYNSYFHMLYHIINNVIPLFLTVYREMCTIQIVTFFSCFLYSRILNKHIDTRVFPGVDPGHLTSSPYIVVVYIVVEQAIQ